MNDGHLLVAYHGCDVTTRDLLVSGRTAIKISKNDYDWLGEGVYFYEADPARAQAFAQTVSANPDRRFTKSPIATPAVVGAVLCVSRTLDLTTRAGLESFADGAITLSMALTAEGVPEDRWPKNVPPEDGVGDVLLRKQDAAVINQIHAARELLEDAPPYQMVRGAFRQGREIVPHSGFHLESHIQLAVRDLSCIRGWFLVPGDELLTEAELVDAKARYDQAVRAYAENKPRRRVKVNPAAAND